MTPRQLRRRHLLGVASVAVVLLGASAGCALGGGGSGGGGGGGGGTASPSTTYRPVPDNQLFAAVRALPDVTDARISHRDNATDGSLYSGTLVTDGSTNPYTTLDAAVAILRQGRQGAQVVLTVAPDKARGIPRQFVSTEILDRSAPDPLTARYGPQPGPGTPPSDPPVPPAPGWSPVSP